MYNKSVDNSSLGDTGMSGIGIENASHEQILSDAAYYICGIYLTILGCAAFVDNIRVLLMLPFERPSFMATPGCAAFVGNILVLLVLTFGRPNFMKVHTVMLFSISTSDLMVSCTAYPLTAVSSFYKQWIFSETTCIVSGFFVYFFIMCNINSLCVMAFCRYIIVCRPDLERYIRGRYIKWQMCFVWAYALFWTGSPLFGWSSYQKESFETSCTLNWDGRTSLDLSYNFLCIVFCYILPVGVFVFCYFHVARSSLFRARAISMRSSVISRRDLAPPELAMEEMCRKFKIRASRHMTLVCIAMVTAFVITWTPYAVLTFFHIISLPVSPDVQVLPTMFAKLNCIVNPLIYCGLCDRFREATKRIFAIPNRVQPLTTVRRRPTGATRNVTEEDITVLGLVDIAPRVSQPSNPGEYIGTSVATSKQTDSDIKIDCVAELSM